MVLAPKDYFLGPVFAAVPQSGPRQVDIDDRRYLIGGFHPLRPELHPPALYVSHARALFVLLSFRSIYDDTRLIRFSFNMFCRRYAASNGGRYSRAIKQILADLMDSYIRVTDLNTQVSHEYRLIERIDIERHPIRRRDAKLANDPQTEMWFNGCELSPEFYSMLNRLAELQRLKLSVFTAIRSPLAQSIYLYIPSRADFHDAHKPFEITLTNLLKQVGFKEIRHKSKRKELFLKHQEEGRSILQQIDGLETLHGVFRATLVETADKTDYKLLTWVEKTPRKKLSGEDSKLVNAYLKSGRSREYLDQALANIPDLSGYELDLLKAAKVDIPKSERYLKMAKAILKEGRFVTLLGEAKADVLEGRPATKNETARLIHRIQAAVGAPVSQANSSRMKDKV